MMTISDKEYPDECTDLLIKYVKMNQRQLFSMQDLSI
jgi:hypothetical protein